MTLLINIQSIILDYVLDHNWVDYKSFANELSKTIISKNPTNHDDLVKIIQVSNIDFFNFNNLPRHLFIEYFPVKEVLLKLNMIDNHNDTISVLFLAANPRDTDPLRLNEEIREIDQSIQYGDFREKINLFQAWAVRISDVQRLLLRYKPNIIHFSGHGGLNDKIVLENNQGLGVSVPPEALSQLFRLFKETISVVLLNACYSKKQAEAISNHIKYVIGMSNAISDEAAIAFSSAFYQALAFQETIPRAFELGLNQISLFDLGEENTPKLFKR